MLGRRVFLPCGLFNMSDGFSIENLSKRPSNDMKRIKLIAPIVVKGFPDVRCGQTITVPGALAHELISSGWAVEAVESPTLQTRDPILEHRDPVVVQEPQKQPGKSSSRKSPKSGA